MAQTAEIVHFPAPQLDQQAQEVRRVVADASNGFIKLADTLMLQLCRTDLSSRESRILNAVIAKTVKYHKAVDWIANVQLAEMTGVTENHISEVKSALIERKILIKEGRKIGINPVVSEWLEKPKAPKTPKSGNTQNRVEKTPKSGSGYPKSGKKLPETGAHNRKTINTIEENNICTQQPAAAKPAKRVTKPQAFRDFFEAYPDHRKGGTDQSAWNAWKSEKLTPEDALAAIAWLTAAGRSQPDTWARQAQGQYCLGIVNFIRSRHWKTPVPAPRKQQSQGQPLDWDDTSWAQDLDGGLI